MIFFLSFIPHSHSLIYRQWFKTAFMVTRRPNLRNRGWSIGFEIQKQISQIIVYFFEVFQLIIVDNVLMRNRDWRWYNVGLDWCFFWSFYGFSFDTRWFCDLSSTPGWGDMSNDGFEKDAGCNMSICLYCNTWEEKEEEKVECENKANKKPVVP